MSNNIIQPEDRKYYIEKPDPNFSPRRNKALIQETLKETDKFFAEYGWKVTDELASRFDMVNSYGRYRFNRGDMSFENYIGRQATRELIGEKILEKLRVAKVMNKLNGNTMFPNGILI